MTKEIERSPEILLLNDRPITDFDGPRGDIHSFAIEIANKELGTDYKVTDIREWNAIRKFALAEGWPIEDAISLQTKCYYNPDNLIKVKPLPGAVELSLWYYNQGEKFPTVTSRDPKYKDVTFAWHEMHMPWIPHEDIFIRENDEMEGEVFKAFIIKKFGYNLFFEDNLSQAKFVLDYTSASVILVSHLGNLDGYEPNRLLRIGSDGINAANLSCLTPILNGVKV